MIKQFWKYIIIGAVLFMASTNTNKVEAVCAGSCEYSDCPAAYGEIVYGQFWISSEGDCDPACSGSSPACCVYWTACCGGGVCPPDDPCDRYSCGETGSDGETVCGDHCDGGCDDASTCGAGCSIDSTCDCYDQTGGPFCGDYSCNCGEDSSCQDCCSADAPGKPSNLKINDLVAPTIAKTALSSVKYSWTYNTDWGAVCADDTKTASLGVQKATNSINLTGFPTSINHPLATKTINMSSVIKCNGDYKWDVLQNNGELDSTKALSTFKVTGFSAPSIGTFTANKTAITRGEAINFTAAATAESGLSTITVVLKLGTTPAGATIATLTTGTIANSPTSYSKTFTWTSACTSAIGTYTAWVTTTDKCGIISAAKLVSFVVNAPVVPTITSLTSNAPLVAGTPYVASENPVTFRATADGPSVADMTLRIKRNGAASYIFTNTQTCTVTPCTKNFLPWTPACLIPKGDYTATVTATNSCGGSSVVKSYPFKVENSYDLTINTYRRTLPMNPLNPLCSSANPSVLETRVNVSYDSTQYPYGANKTSTGSQSTFSNIPAHAFPVNIGASKAGSNCKNYQFYCIGSQQQQTQQPINIPTTTPPLADCGEIVRNISIGEEKKDSWETVINGNVYAPTALVTTKCDDATVGGGFRPTMLSGEGYVSTAEEIVYHISNINAVYDPKGGYAKNLDPTVTGDVNKYKIAKSNDKWFDSFVFPTSIGTPLPITATAATWQNLTQNIYYMNGNFTTPAAGLTFDVNSPNSTTIIYITGYLTIKGTIKPLNATSGDIIFIVKGVVNINPTVKISNYTTASAFNTKTPSLINANIVSLSSTSTGVVFKTAAGDGPVILTGMIATKDDIAFNRDLGVNNALYPAHVIKYDTSILGSLHKVINSGLKTGLETYDVQWVYD